MDKIEWPQTATQPLIASVAAFFLPCDDGTITAVFCRRTDPKTKRWMDEHGREFDSLDQLLSQIESRDGY